MPKNVRFESFKYRFLVAAQDAQFSAVANNQISWIEFIRGLDFACENSEIVISWQLPCTGSIVVPLDIPQFYVRGDREKCSAMQSDTDQQNSEDAIKLNNADYFREIVGRTALSAGYTQSDTFQAHLNQRLIIEREFHDAWAESEDTANIDIRASNEVCTAPEMRFITQRLGNIAGKRLLDVGCGLGEASVYFAMLGAEVTASDLSQGMLDSTTCLARANNFRVTPHVASAEDLQLPPGAEFDIIYAGNLLHHVDIEEVLNRLKAHLTVGGRLVTWDPLAYNPIINLYRYIAKDVRTPDEHPLRWSDIKLFRKHFDIVETRYFWLTTLIIFVIMALVQRRNPNKERYWKTVVQEGEKWRWLYRPLEYVDRLLLTLFPPLRMLCWNVVVVCGNKGDRLT